MIRHFCSGLSTWLAFWLCFGTIAVTAIEPVVHGPVKFKRTEPWLPPAARTVGPTSGITGPSSSLPTSTGATSNTTTRCLSLMGGTETSTVSVSLYSTPASAKSTQVPLGTGGTTMMSAIKTCEGTSQIVPSF
jgi:hypothetical protein